MTAPKTRTLRNISPLGALDVPLLGRTVDAGDTFEASGEAAVRLLEQPDVFEEVEPTSQGQRQGTNNEKGTS